MHWIFNRQILAQVLDSIQNIHPSIASEKMTFINAVLESEVNVLHTPGQKLACLDFSVY